MVLTRHSVNYRKNIQWSFAGSLATAIFQFAQMAVFARFSGPEAAGDYALAATLIGFLTTIAEAGLPQSIIQSETIDRLQLRMLALVGTLLGAFLFAVLYFLGPVVAAWYASEALSGLLLLMGATLIFGPLGAQRTALLSKALQFGTLAKIEVTGWAISFSVTTLLLCFGWSTRAMAMGFLCRNLVTTLAGLLASRRFTPPEWRNRNIGAYLRYGFFDFSASWAEFLANYLDKLIVGKWLGMQALGYYNLAFTFLMLPTARIAGIITRVSFPVFVQLRSKKRTLQVFFEKSTRDICLALFPVYGLLILFPDEIITLIYGKNWLAAAPLFSAFGFAGLVRTLSTPFPQLLRGFGKPQVWLKWLLAFTVCLNTVLCLVLWLDPEPAAAAWTRTFVKFFVEIPMLWWLARRSCLRFGPVMAVSGQWLLRLSPVWIATWLTGFWPGGFWLVLLLKAAVFSSGTLWLLYREIKLKSS